MKKQKTDLTGMSMKDSRTDAGQPDLMRMCLKNLMDTGQIENRTMRVQKKIRTRHRS